MKKAKNIFFRTSNTIIFGILALLGFTTSCNKETPATMYGVPSAKFIVDGNVGAKDTNTPIQNIRVVMNMDTSYTDSEGNYQVVENNGFAGDQTFNMEFKDVDGVSNGEFAKLDTTVEFINPQFTGGDGSWYEGETTKEFDVKLDED